MIPSRGGLTIILSKLNSDLKMEVTEEVYRTMFHDYPDAVCSTDLKGYFLTINKAFKDLFHVEEDCIKGKHFSSYI
ncbi:PAS domain S-box protein, partial [Pseudomonas sp. 2995-1]|uniref:PAS domain S-box protein n=1 Tax=Pseudomonas sp. 2995-1 TaxID=1712679 RepID=UPI00130469E2